MPWSQLLLCLRLNVCEAEGRSDVCQSSGTQGAALSEEQRGAQLCRERGGERAFLRCPCTEVWLQSLPLGTPQCPALAVGLCSVPGQQSSAFPAGLSALQSVGVRMIQVSRAPGFSPQELSL